jgi:hypothetical protein
MFSAYSQGLGLLQSQNASSTITTTSTFQSIWPAQSRSSCLIQNNGTHTMYVFFGPIASATTAHSYQLTTSATPPGQSISCNNGVTVIQDQISITGTTADAFYASEQ